jgi:hypothetical protein
MQLKFSILAGAVVVGLPAAAAAQMSGGYSSQTSAPAGTQQQGAAQAAGSGQVAKASKADVKAGAVVYDQQGGEVAKVESVDDQGAVLNTGSLRAKVPFAALGKGDKGLLIGVSKSELEAKAKEKAATK